MRVGMTSPIDLSTLNAILGPTKQVYIQIFKATEKYIDEFIDTGGAAYGTNAHNSVCWHITCQDWHLPKCAGKQPFSPHV